MRRTLRLLLFLPFCLSPSPVFCQVHPIEIPHEMPHTRPPETRIPEGRPLEGHIDLGQSHFPEGSHIHPHPHTGSHSPAEKNSDQTAESSSERSSGVDWREAPFAVVLVAFAAFMVYRDRKRSRTET